MQAPPSLDVAASLQRHFGFEQFRPGQREVIEHLMAGRSAAAVFPTGGGKSLCYQLPAIELDGLTLVISPLIALMKDQIDALRRRGIAAERLDSTLDGVEYRRVIDALRSGALRLLYVAPERFANERFRATIERLPIALFAIDEAHCISEWGHNFRPDYLKLPVYAKRCGAQRLLALTATATPRVLDDICRGFEIAPGCAVRTGVYRPNLTLLATPTTPATRDAQLIERLRSRPPGPTIVYVTLQRTAEEVAQRLRAAGFDAAHYHAGCDDEIRTQVQDAFLASGSKVIVATIAFGMGIDKADIRTVMHYNLPKSLENLSQEIGRAGRDGLPSTCELLATLDDLTVLENFVYGDTPSREAIRGLLAELFESAGQTAERVREESGETLELALITLGNAHDLRPLVLRTLLTQLELAGLLDAGTPFYADYRFKPKATSAAILERFSGERRQFLAALFRQAKKASTWFSLDLAKAAQTLAAPRERLIRALDYLAEQDLLEVKVAGVRHRYHILRRPEDPEALADQLHRTACDFETREIGRVRQVVELLGGDGCLTASLCEHFGETLGQACGHCSWCLSGEAAVLAAPSAPPIDERRWAEAERVRAEHPEALAEPRAFARFLCGLGSPRLSREKLTRHALFGCFSEVAFGVVLGRVESAKPSARPPASDLSHSYTRSIL